MIMILPITLSRLPNPMVALPSWPFVRMLWLWKDLKPLLSTWVNVLPFGTLPSTNHPIYGTVRYYTTSSYWDLDFFTSSHFIYFWKILRFEAIPAIFDTVVLLNIHNAFTVTTLCAKKKVLILYRYFVAIFYLEIVWIKNNFDLKHLY
jgi:hypothetical protein